MELNSVLVVFVKNKILFLFLSFSNRAEREVMYVSRESAEKA